MKKIIQSFVLGALVLGLASTALAAEVKTGTKANPNVLIGVSETHKNLYTVGGNVTVNGDTKGDLTAAGGLVTIDGNVEKDLLLAGGTLNVSGTIGDNARIAGGNITVTGPVKGDLVIAGGNIVIAGSASVDGDLLVAGGNISIDAPVKGNVKIVGGNVTINRKIDGNVEVKTSQSLIFGPNADIAGTINHTGKTKAEVQEGAKISNINFTQLQAQAGAKKALAGIFTIAFLLQILAWMAAAWLLMHFKKSWVTEVSNRVQSQPWSNLGWGLVYLVAIPLTVILLLFTLVGYYAAFMVGAAYVMLLLAAKIFAAITVGFVIVKLLNKPNDGIPMWQPVVIGTVAWAVLGLIPFVGWVVLAVVFLQTFGALAKTAGNAMKEGN